MSRRTKLALSVLGALLLLFVLDAGYEGLKTLRQLDVIEAERDTWQRPSEVVAALDLKQGDTVVDLGCGSGYFALKLSSVVGPDGKVYAVDIRRLSLTFLWARTVRKDRHNITTALGHADDPRLPSGVANVVLVVNTYHEFNTPDTILDRVFDALKPGGRLVIVDPKLTEHGGASPNSVEAQLRRHRFDIVRVEDRFTEQPGGGEWWMIVARRP